MVSVLAGTFEEVDVTHIEGDVDPVRDMEIIHDELRLKDVEYVEKQVVQMEKTVGRGSDKSRKGEYVSGLWRQWTINVRPLLLGAP